MFVRVGEYAWTRDDEKRPIKMKINIPPFLRLGFFFFENYWPTFKSHRASRALHKSSPDVRVARYRNERASADRPAGTIDARAAATANGRAVIGGRAGTRR